MENIIIPVQRKLNFFYIEEYFKSKDIFLVSAKMISPNVDYAEIIIRFRKKQKFRYHPIMNVTEVDFNLRTVKLNVCTETFNNYYKTNKRRPQNGKID